jgi:PAS domain S-box-containing protein
VRDSDAPSLAVPIVARRSGLFGVLSIEGRAFDADEERLVAGLAREAGLALEAANLYERAVAEKDKSEAILSRVADAVVVTDPKERILEWNEAAERIFARTAAEVVGRGCGRVLGLHVGERQLDCSQGCALLATTERSDPALDVEVWRSREDGKRQPLLANVSAVGDPHGKVAEVIHSLRDITRLKEADEAKSMFLATASHELKTPLTVIQGFSHLLSKSRLESEEVKQEALGAMEARAIQLNKIVDRLMLSSRIETGRAHVSLEEVNPAPLLRERVEALAGATGREISVDLASELPTVSADPDVMATVVDHLLDNAIKYSPDGGPVAVAARYDDEAVTVSVADSGIGMDPEQLEMCFQKFWQGESSDSRRFGGTGIGLYIVQSLVEAMGGEVHAESKPGVGSTFIFTLVPWSASAAAAETKEEIPGPGSGEQSMIREFMRQIGVSGKE